MEKYSSGSRKTCLKNVNYFNENKEFVRGNIYISSGKISKIDHVSEIIQEGYAVLDASDCYAQPGYTNSHIHPSKDMYCGYSVYDSISNVLDAVHKNNSSETEELQFNSSISSLKKQILSGVTGIGIFTSRANIDAEAALSLGVRANIQYAVNDTWVGKESVPVIQNKESILNQFHDTYSRYSRDTITVSPATASEISCSDELLIALNNLAKEYNSFISLHINEGQHQYNQCIEHFGKSGIKRLNSLGLLDSHINLIHNCYLNEDDINIINQKPETKVIHCPISNSFVGAGTLPVSKLKNSISLGTDAAMVNPSNSIVQDTIFALYHHGTDELHNKINPEKLIDMVTINGAHCLGFKNCGLIKEGFSADIIIYNDEEPYKINNKTPDINKFIVNMFNKHPKHVFINGQQLVENFNFIERM
ncbi:amidohydrolase family protein [Vibrio spartinae]|uniref:8-oxoguanine deaminase n=1 Tax=Vibrio spartinae TaxID=1918945 RepID=A0A1N6M210_9VIBR|nr:amidohydrolase family protein [Vibrio spartinae]SIO93473.1 8-oxoguanine deaminase [Vibrio spartinae]